MNCFAKVVYLPSLVHNTSPSLRSTRSTQSSCTTRFESPSVSTTPLALRHHCSAPAARLRLTSTQISTVALARMPETIFSGPIGGEFAASGAAAAVEDRADRGGATITSSELLGDGTATPSAKCTWRRLIGLKPLVLRINFHAASDVPWTTWSGQSGSEARIGARRFSLAMAIEWPCVARIR